MFLTPSGVKSKSPTLIAVISEFRFYCLGKSGFHHFTSIAINHHKCRRSWIHLAKMSPSKLRDGGKWNARQAAKLSAHFSRIVGSSVGKIQRRNCRKQQKNKFYCLLESSKSLYSHPFFVRIIDACQRQNHEKIIIITYLVLKRASWTIWSRCRSYALVMYFPMSSPSLS